ncbi:MAG: hypothetical protein ABIJ16_13880 [Bacteroidota bacterium]
MRRIIIFSVFVFASIALMGQGLLNNGAQMVLTAGSNVLIAGNGNWTNNGIATCNSASTVHFIGNADQNIQGTNTTAFGNLTVNNTGGDVIVGRNISVLNTLQMNSGDFDLKDYVVDLSTTGNLNNEASARRVKATNGAGSDGLGTGTLQATRNNPSGNVAGLGLNITPSAALGNTVLLRGHERQPGSGTFAGNWSIFRYYEIQPASYSDCDFIFSYYPAWELNGHTDGDLLGFQRVNYGGPTYWNILTTVNASPTASATTVNNVLIANVRVTLGSNTLPLPVELIGFTGECDQNSVILKWQTASEKNSDYFDIERSNNGEDFYNIGTVSAAGNSNELTSYSFVDTQTGNKTYYRLKEVDSDGFYFYSNIIAVDCGTPGAAEIFVVNQQGGGDINIVINNAAGTNYQIRFIDQIGRVMVSKIMIIDAESFSFVINKAGFSCGIYNLIISSDTEIISKQIIIAY